MPTFNSVLTVTLVPTEAIQPNRFVTFAGATAGAGEAARGVTHDGNPDNVEKSLPVIALGTAILETGAAVNPGDMLVSDANGRGIPETDAADEVINAVAIGSADGAGEFIEVVVVPPITRSTMVRAAAQADSVAADTAGIVADFNALLAKLRTAGIIAE